MLLTYFELFPSLVRVARGSCSFGIRIFELCFDFIRICSCFCYSSSFLWFFGVLDQIPELCFLARLCEKYARSGLSCSMLAGIFHTCFSCSWLGLVCVRKGVYSCLCLAYSSFLKRKSLLISLSRMLYMFAIIFEYIVRLKICFHFYNLLPLVRHLQQLIQF